MPRTIELHSPDDSESLRAAKQTRCGHFACRHRARYAETPPKNTSASSPSAVASTTLRVRSVAIIEIRLAHAEFLKGQIA